MVIDQPERTESEMLNHTNLYRKEISTVPSGKPKNPSSDTPQTDISTEVELQEFKNITSQVMQDALQVWAQLWGELEAHVPSEDGQRPPIAETEEASCEWSDFIEKMWLLRHYLDFTKRLSQQDN